MRYLPTYVVCLVTFFALDLIWLGLIADGFYDRHLGFLMRDAVNWPAAIAFYLIYLAGLVHFPVRLAVKAGTIRSGVLQGAAFGLVTYAAFDLTSLALVEGFGLTVTLVDMAWGTVLGGTVSAAGTAFSLRGVESE